MTADREWPPAAEALLPLLGLSPSAEVVADPGMLLRRGRERAEADTLVARTAWLIADGGRGVVVLGRPRAPSGGCRRRRAGRPPPARPPGRPAPPPGGGRPP